RACLEEVREPGNRRYRYPFTNCTHCGPRLSIIRSIPYDRAGTSMAEFTQCPACQGEYDDPADRRFHAQPNACAVCGPRLWLEDAHGEALENAGEADAVARAAALIRRGAILAVKGIGGVHLACDAANDDAVGRLRRRKRRYHKAFALMGRDLAMLGRYVRVSPLERQALLSPAAPIVVMERIAGHGLSAALAPGQNTLGFMLPYTPLHHLLMDALEGPIVLTSGNRSDEPQCIGNGESRHRLEGVADYWLLHDREIVNRLDDSVVREMAGRVRVVRRGRGYAPTPLVLPAGFAAAPPLLALGAELKNTFCLMQEGRAILSQHMGDLEEAATHREYRRSLDLYQGLFRHRPAALAVDMHPDYLSTQWGREWAAREGLELHRVQHHHAHITACMAEQGLDLDSGPVLGIALDGLGYGADGGIWGGEFMRVDYLGFERLASFEPVAMIGGARAIHEPWRNTYAHLAPWWGEVEARYPELDLVRFLRARPLATLDAMLERGLNSPRASSAGRLFDAVAAALGLSREAVSHEGQAAIELGVKEDVIKHDLGKLLLKCEALQAAHIEAAQAPKESAVTLDDEETKAALELLKSPDLLARIQNDFTRCGVVGEATNKLVGYLAVVSRKLDSPLAVTIQSTSAAGKSSLMDAVLAFMPEEDRIKYSAMTGQSLFYMGETDLQHKVLAIVEEEGASNAAYALKLLQSEGELTIASTGKDPITGELKTQDYQVKGPVMIMLTTTAIDIDEELLNRCIVLSIDEGREQTKAIHNIQRNKRTLAGLMAKADKESILSLHQNAQRLLQPLAVMNPYAKHLTFVDDRTRTRRDHEKYLTLIDTLALLHQHQRPIKSVDHHGQAIRYVEVTLEDIETANRLAHEALGRTLDELPPQTRKLLAHIREMVAQHCQAQAMAQKDHRFSRRDIRAHTGWSDGQLKIHCRRLTELEYLLVHRGGRGQCIEYELLYDGQDDERPHLMGLIDVETLRYDVEKAGVKPQKTAPSQGQDRPKSAPSQGGKNGRKPSNGKASGDLEGEEPEKALIRPRKGNGSYRNHAPAMSAKAAE
ncbi:MAG: carbamoyltransferase HypF, partial [Candidatus Sedimenticola endophacoides]